MANVKRIYICKDYGCVNRFKHVNTDHTPYTKRNGEVKASCSATVSWHDRSDWLEISMEEIVYHKTGRNISKVITTQLDDIEAKAMYSFLHAKYGK